MTERLRVIVRGAVQGVGFRPFVFRLANELQLAGWVSNTSQGVFIEVEGEPEVLRQFAAGLISDKPERAFIQSSEASFLDAIGYTGFAIRESEESGAKTALILPDIATCAECLREIFDPDNRRFRYPFTNCTNCGPRFSIIEALPYDRGNTSMKKFPMCAACAQEYAEPRDRRFHAEPTACPACGPRLQLSDSLGKVLATEDAALLQTADALRAGRIVALKGIGGFQLLVDARNEEAVRTLRQRKHREEKPFAVMFPSLASIQECCDVSDSESALLLSPEAPIVLVGRARRARRASDHPPPDGPAVRPYLAGLVAPGNPNLGVMLPYSPLHHLLMRELDFPIVATSGNLSDEPICIDEDEALIRLRGIADLFLVHDRPIVRQVDDSIVRMIAGREAILRRARGYAPLPLRGAHAPSRVASSASPAAGAEMAPPVLKKFEKSPTIHPSSGPIGEAPIEAREDACAPQILAVGAHLKNAVALQLGENVFVSQHIGDLSTQEAYDAFTRIARELPQLYDTAPALIAHDLHPEYLSTKFALQQPGEHIAVQHHWAHIAACLAENEIAAPALGVSWDGTGYGLDGTIWGGEFLLAQNNGFVRVAHFRAFPLPGGDAAVKEPRRSALGLLFEIHGTDLWKHSALTAAFAEEELRPLRTMLAKGINSPRTSSVGRLFDGVAALLRLHHRSTFEGQAAMALEFAIEPGIEESYEFQLRGRAPIVIDWQAAIEAILRDHKAGESIGVIAAKFHNMLAEIIVAIARDIAEPKVALSGGCFQNRYLTERAIARLRAENFSPYWHQRVPPNDGGIALGQIAAAAWSLRQE